MNAMSTNTGKSTVLMLNTATSSSAASPVGTTIPHSRPFLGDDVEKAASEVSRTAMIGAGPYVEHFEARFADMHKAAGAVATNSGSAALHLSLLALKTGPGDEVVIPSYVCTAVLNSIQYVGATPVLADSEVASFNLSFDDVLAKITGRTRAIIVPHMFGEPADIPRFKTLGVPIIEDCAQALGADLDGRLVGSMGDLSVFSFHATKMITTGCGGMVVANTPDLVERIADLRDYDARDNYLIRYNYQLSDLAALIGLRQLDRLDTFISRRRELARIFSESITHSDFELPKQSHGGVYYRYVIRSPRPEQLIALLADSGIQAKRPVYKPLHHYSESSTNLIGCDRIYASAVSLPLYPALQNAEVDAIMLAPALHP